MIDRPTNISVCRAVVYVIQSLYKEELTILDTTSLFAEMVRWLHFGGSIVGLLEPL